MFKLFRCATAMSLIAELVVPAYLAAQDQDRERDHLTRYQVFNLGTLGGTSSAGNTINNLSWAMGSANLSGDNSAHATVWIYGLKFDLGTLGGPNSNVIFPNRNDRGEIVGISQTKRPDPLGEAWSCSAFFPPPTATSYTCLGFIWKWGAMSALPTLGGNNGFAAAVNDLGQVVGWAETSLHDPTCVRPQVLQFEAVVWGPETGQIQRLPSFDHDPDTAATAINNKGQVVGISGTCDVAVGAFSAKHAVLWENGRVINLGSLGGEGWNTPVAINNRGDIAGFSDLPGDVSGGVLTPNFHAFLWTKERGMQDLGTLPGDSISEATGINDHGQIVGVSFPSSHAFIWQKGVMVDLNTLVSSGSGLSLISTGDINDKGEITGQACVVSNGICSTETPAFLAIPEHDRDDRNASPGTRADQAEAPMAIVPENVLRRVQRGWIFSRANPR